MIDRDTQSTYYLYSQLIPTELYRGLSAESASLFQIGKDKLGLRFQIGMGAGVNLAFKYGRGTPPVLETLTLPADSKYDLAFPFGAAQRTKLSFFAGASLWFGACTYGGVR